MSDEAGLALAGEITRLEAENTKLRELERAEVGLVLSLRAENTRLEAKLRHHDSAFPDCKRTVDETYTALHESREECARLREALAFYADKNSWLPSGKERTGDVPAFHDAGSIARAALATPPTARKKCHHHRLTKRCYECYPEPTSSDEGLHGKGKY